MAKRRRFVVDGNGSPGHMEAKTEQVTTTGALISKHTSFHAFGEQKHARPPPQRRQVNSGLEICYQRIHTRPPCTDHIMGNCYCPVNFITPSGSHEEWNRFVRPARNSKVTTKQSGPDAITVNGRSALNLFDVSSPFPFDCDPATHTERNRKTASAQYKVFPKHVHNAPQECKGYWEKEAEALKYIKEEEVKLLQAAKHTRSKNVEARQKVNSSDDFSEVKHKQQLEQNDGAPSRAQQHSQQQRILPQEKDRWYVSAYRAGKNRRRIIAAPPAPSADDDEKTGISQKEQRRSRASPSPANVNHVVGGIIANQIKELEEQLAVEKQKTAALERRLRTVAEECIDLGPLVICHEDEGDNEVLWVRCSHQQSSD